MGVSSISVVVGLITLLFGIYLYQKGQRSNIAVILMIIGAVIMIAPVTLIYLLLD